jgi:hypothetical protein
MNERLLDGLVETVIPALAGVFGAVARPTFDDGSEIILAGSSDKSLLQSLRFFILGIESAKVWKVLLPGLVTQAISNKLTESLRVFEKFLDMVRSDYYLNCDVMNLAEADQRFFDENRGRISLTLEAIQDPSSDVKSEYTSKLTFRGGTDTEREFLDKVVKKPSARDTSQAKITFADFDGSLSKKATGVSQDKRHLPMVGSRFSRPTHDEQPKTRSARESHGIQIKAQLTESVAANEKPKTALQVTGSFVTQAEADTFKTKLSESQFETLVEVDGLIALKNGLLKTLFGSGASARQIHQEKIRLQERMNDIYPRMEEFLYLKNELLQQKQRDLVGQLNFINLVCDDFLELFEGLPENKQDVATLRTRVAAQHQKCFGKPPPEAAGQAEITEINGVKLHRKPRVEALVQMPVAPRDAPANPIWNPLSKEFSKREAPKGAGPHKQSEARKPKKNFYDSIIELENTDGARKGPNEVDPNRSQIKDLINSKLRNSSLSARLKSSPGRARLVFAAPDLDAKPKPKPKHSDAENKENSYSHNSGNQPTHDRDPLVDRPDYTETLNSSRVKFQRLGLRLGAKGGGDVQNSTLILNQSKLQSQKKRSPYEVSEYLEPDVISKLEEDNSALKEKKRRLESQVLEMSCEINRASDAMRMSSSKKWSKFDRPSMMEGSHRSNSFRLLKRVDSAAQMIEEFNRKESQYVTMQRKYEQLKKKIENSALGPYYGEDEAIEDGRRITRSRRTSSLASLRTTLLATQRLDIRE